MKTAILVMLLMIASPNYGEVAPPPAPPPAPHLWVYCSSHCYYCRKAEKASKGDTLFDWHFIHVTKENPPPTWITETLARNAARQARGEEGDGYPFFVFYNGNRVADYFCGFTDLSDLARRYKAKL